MWDSIQTLSMLQSVGAWSLAILIGLSFILTVGAIIVGNRLEALKEQAKAPRRSSSAQKVKILMALPKDPHNVTITCTMGDGESFDYASDFIDVMKEAG
jgi:hypothetical protein